VATPDPAGKAIYAFASRMLDCGDFNPETLEKLRLVAQIF
jgi:hypothetical protein